MAKPVNRLHGRERAERLGIGAARRGCAAHTAFGEALAIREVALQDCMDPRKKVSRDTGNLGGAQSCLEMTTDAGVPQSTQFQSVFPIFLQAMPQLGKPRRQATRCEVSTRVEIVEEVLRHRDANGLADLT